MAHNSRLFKGESLYLNLPLQIYFETQASRNVPRLLESLFLCSGQDTKNCFLISLISTHVKRTVTNSKQNLFSLPDRDEIRDQRGEKVCFTSFCRFCFRYYSLLFNTVTGFTKARFRSIRVPSPSPGKYFSLDKTGLG